MSFVDLNVIKLSLKRVSDKFDFDERLFWLQKSIVSRFDGDWGVSGAVFI